MSSSSQTGSVSSQKQVLFWLLVAGFLAVVVAYDQSVLYLYAPRPVAVLVALVLVCPGLYFLGGRNRLTYGVMALVAVAPFAVAPLPGTTLKNFYLDCEAIEQGETKQQVTKRMAGYSTSLDAWGSKQKATIEQAPGASGETPYIYTPSEAHDADFCMVYLRGDVVERVVLSPD